MGGGNVMLKKLDTMPTKTTKKKYVYREKSPLGHYKADAFLVRCVDNRFWKSTKHFVKELGMRHVDPKSPAGGAKVFSSPFEESDREYFLRELGISMKLHHVGRVMLFTHHDCGAYGGFAKFDNNHEAELSFHEEEHAKATKVIYDRFPDLIVETYFIDKDRIIRTS